MHNDRKLNHTTYDCKYHIVWIPKYRKKAIYGHLRKYLGEVFKDLALQSESEILEGHLLGDHAHILIAIPPQYSVAQVVGYMKGKSAIHIARTYAILLPLIKYKQPITKIQTLKKLGRGKLGPAGKISVPIKDIWVYPLDKKFRTFA